MFIGLVDIFRQVRDETVYAISRFYMTISVTSIGVIAYELDSPGPVVITMGVAPISHPPARKSYWEADEVDILCPYITIAGDGRLRESVDATVGD